MAALALPGSAMADHSYLTQWGSFGAGAEQFDTPGGIEADAHDNVYVADFGNARVQKFGSDGEPFTSWGNFTGSAALDLPTDVAVDSLGNVYVADVGHDRVVKLNSSGNFVSQLGCPEPTVDCTAGTGDGQFISPTGVATDSSNNVYVADQGNHRVQKFDSSGVFQWAFGGSAAGPADFDPSGVDVSPGGTLYVTDTGNDRVERWDVSGLTASFIGSFDGSGSGNSAFVNPFNVAVSASTGKVFVVDSEGNSAEQFSAAGAYEAKWDAAGSGNGQFLEPLGIATGTLDRFWVSDTGNNRLQKFGVAIDGTVVRISGTRLVVEADSGASNQLTVTGSGPAFAVTDTGDTVVGGGGCLVAASTATCTSSAIASIRITSGDDADLVTVTGSAPATINGGDGIDDLTGGTGNDTLIGGAGADDLNGGGGTDTASYAGSASGVTASLHTDTATGGDTIADDVENLTGSSFDDTLEGDELANTLTGGDGTDTVTHANSSSAVVASLEAGTATGGAGGDTIAADVENLTGSAFGDTLTGDTGANAIAGGGGDDDIQVRDASTDSADCGSGTDAVTADAADTATADCESVLRPTSGGGDTGGGPGGGGTAPAPSIPGAAPAPSAPALSSLKAPRMRSGRAGTFSYSLDRAAGVTIALERVQRGRRSGNACKKQTRKNRKKRACTFFAPVGKLTQAGKAGRNLLRFPGKLGGRKLKPGVYRATAVATTTGGTSAPATARFTVTR
jgi:hypothetical protein